ncbi:MAG TPA: hypothetical protein VFJ91_05555 [Gaiellaceae bacterium]|nr:hypothetical protein [Gaiellaceae bacterium]
MRALALLAALAGLSVLLATANGGRHWPIGWTGYAPLGRTVTCSASGNTATLTFSSGPVRREGASQTVCTFGPRP